MTDMKRQVFRITGGDREKFLQDLVTNDVGGLANGLVYTALLTPQGKYLADFFLVPAPDAVLLDAPAFLADGLMRRLALYKLRADVHIAESALAVSQGIGTPPAGGFADPRHAALGWRAYGDAATQTIPQDDWDARRVAHCVPAAGIELIPDASFILEAGFDRLNGVDFRKGCYVGQEVTARMRHKTELRKGLARVRVAGSAPAGTPIEAGGKAAGTLYTQADGAGIAYLRFDRARGEMQAGEAVVTLEHAA